jgi:molybdenum cofactor cytidylyltransferase
VAVPVTVMFAQPFHEVSRISVMTISGVVLAAGGATRMGTQKLLLPLGDTPIVRCTVNEMIAAGLDEVVAVLGFEHQAVAAALASLPVRVVVNADYHTGMGSSFRRAVAAVAGSDAAMFALADQPFVTAAHYRELAATYLAHPGGIVCVKYGEVTAPPHVFSRAFFPELSVLEHGARPVLQRHRDQTTVLQLPEELLQDIDTPEDYERARERWSRER